MQLMLPTRTDPSSSRAFPSFGVSAGLGGRTWLVPNRPRPRDGREQPANVRENADIFVMVVGARYGSVDAEADKSATNLEDR